MADKLVPERQKTVQLGRFLFLQRFYQIDVATTIQSQHTVEQIRQQQQQQQLMDVQASARK